MAGALARPSGANKGGPPDFGTKSHTRKDVTLTILGTQDAITIPLEVSTKVVEVKALLSQKLGVDAERIRFTYKVGAGHRNLLDTDEIRSGIVRGISSWEREQARYPHPVCIIGAGHMGLRQALSLLKEGINEFVLYEKLDKVGGRAWVVDANATSKLQTELGVYHLQYDADYAVPRSTMKTWPTRLELLQHFHDVSVEFGIMPHVQLGTEVSKLRVQTDDANLPFYDVGRQHYDLATLRLTGGVQEDAEASFSVVMYYPGGLVNPVEEEFKGENLFDGPIGLGACDSFDYSTVRGHVPAIVGFGAFGVENVRTCVENGASKVWLICRRKNIIMPRVVSWFANQSLYPPTCAMVLDALKPMYDLIPDDPWTYYAVQGNAERTVATVRQRARFGISDVFFLAHYYKKVEVVVDSIKRLRPHLIILEGGDPLPADHLIKVLGFKGDLLVDKLMGTSEMVGHFVNGDWRRWVCAEFPGVDANKLGGTSLSPFGLQVAETMSWIIRYPRDLAPVLQSGMLPTKRADVSKTVPAYVWDPRSGTMISMILTGGMIPGLAEIGAGYGVLNRAKQLEAHPHEQYVDECADEWAAYCKAFRDEGDDRPFPPYPYTHAFVKELCERNDAEGAAEMARRGQ